jgi:predicted NUDIX family NTP pyrophosphohydrolase
MKNRIGEKAPTKTYITIESLKALLVYNKKAFADFLISHGNESLWMNKDAYNWAVNYVENNAL